MAKLRGWKFPIDVDETTGRIMTVEGNENVKQSVRIILQTERGERRMLPSFGSRINRFVFASLDSAVKHMLSDEITYSLNRWEEHIENLNIEVYEANNDGVSSLRANIEYNTDLNPYETEMFTNDLNGKNDFEY